MPGQNRKMLTPRQQSDPLYVNMWIANLSNRVNHIIGFISILNGGFSSATVPSSYEISGKWGNSKTAIHGITLFDGGYGTIDLSSSVTVCGSSS